MRPSNVSSDGRVINEAAAAVQRALGPTTWWERRRVRQWIRRSPVHAQEFLLASLIYESCRHVDPKGLINVHELLEEAEHTVVPLSAMDDAAPASPEPEENRGGAAYRDRLEVSESGSFSQRFGSIRKRTAIALLLLPALPLLAPTAPLPALSAFSTGANESRTVNLESGSVIYLNELTSLTIAHGWRGYQVQLLRGEAFFDIRHSTDPLIWIGIGNALVKDNGTSFDIRRSQDEATVSVLDGSVTVQSMAADTQREPPSTEPTEKIGPVKFFTVVSAGTELTIQGSPSDATVQPKSRSLDEMQHATAWRMGWLTFTGESLADVARVFNAYNRRQIIIADPSIARMQVGGRFLAGDVESFVSSLAATMAIQVLPDSGGPHDSTIRLARAATPSVGYHQKSIPDKP